MAKKRATRKRTKGRIPPPKCKAILLCDQTILEAGSGKISLIGIFANFNVQKFPAVVAPFRAYVQLVNGIGRYEVVVEIHDLQKDKVLARAQGIGIEFADRFTTVNIMMPVPPLPLAHAGKYDLVVLANGQEIDRQQFTAVSMEDMQRGPDNP